MQKKRILLIGGNYLPEPTGIGKYSGEMMKWLAGEGHDCAVVTSYPYYPHWAIQSPYERKSYWYTKELDGQISDAIKVYRCPHYIPKNPSGLKRIVSDFTFFISAFIQVCVLLFQTRYDYVIAVAPPFQIGLLGIFYRWIKGGKFIYHVQDLQIDAAKELGMIKSKSLLNVMLKIEEYVLRKADFLSTISEGMIVKIMNKCRKPVIFFPNWVDTQTFHPLEKKSQLKQQYHISPEEKIVLYSGAIGEKQGLDSILNAAKALSNQKIRFIICGSGPYKEKLSLKAQRLGLNNILFLPLQPKEEFNEFLNMADIHLVLQKKNANDLVMPSKLSTILSVGGLALVTASRKTSLYNIITRHDMGIVVEPENQAALIDSIRSAIEHSYTSMKANARNFAIEFLTINNVIEKFMSEISPPVRETLAEVIIKKTHAEADLIS